MSELHVVAGLLAGALSIIGYIPYALSSLRGHTKPNRATWMILTVVGLMLLLTNYSLDADDDIWLPLGYFLGPLIIFVISFSRGEGGLAILDVCCILGACLSGLIWWLFGSPIAAMAINLLMDFLGLLPTALKAKARPHTEQKWAWMLWFIGSLVNLLAIRSWGQPRVIYAVYMVIGNGLLLTIVIWPRKKTVNLARHI